MKRIKNSHYLIALKDCGDNRGGLTIIESESQFPYKIQRIFYEYNTTNEVTRGNHANRCSRFGFVSITGSCSIEVDDGNEKVEYQLDSPNKLLFIDNMVWKVMKNFTENNVLLVLSDQKYNENEYIRDYEEFKSIVKGV